MLDPKIGDVVNVVVGHYQQQTCRVNGRVNSDLFMVRYGAGGDEAIVHKSRFRETSTREKEWGEGYCENHPPRVLFFTDPYVEGPIWPATPAHSRRRLIASRGDSK